MSTKYERELLVNELQAIVTKFEANRESFTSVKPLINELKEVLINYAGLKTRT